MAALLAGRLPRQAYAALLRDLHLLYSALEAGLDDNQGAPWLDPFDLAALRRAPALAADLLHLATTPAARATAPARDYAERLSGLAAARSPTLLAHVYTRYLGDLHGGQILQRLVTRQYGDIGARFYDFGTPAQVQSLREAVRGALAAAPLSAAEADGVVEEARWSFNQHCAMFEALAA